MLLVPRVRQRSPISCLPTCIWAALTYQKRNVSYSEIEDACDLDPLGAQLDVALRNLGDVGLDVDVLVGFDLQAIRELLEADRPVILSLQMAKVGNKFLAHAVVVCAANEEQVVVMDPLIGEYAVVPRTEAELTFCRDFIAGFTIAGQTAGAESAS